MAVDGSVPASAAVRTLASGLPGPDGVAVDASGDVFVANYDDNTVREIVAERGAIPALPTIKTIGSGFNGPSNLSIDAAGNVFVADNNDGMVKEIVAAGGYSSVITLGSGFGNPAAMAVLHNGSVVVADAGNNAVNYLDYTDAPALTFESAVVGQTSGDSPLTVMLSNDGTAPLNFALPTTGSSPSVPTNFLWDSSSTCEQTTSSSTPFALAGGASCTMAFDFKPTAAGSVGGLAEWTDNNLNFAGTLQAIQLTGTGLALPTVSLSATSLSFGSVTVGASSGSQSVTLTNTSNTVLTITSIAVTGAHASSFVFANSCGTSLAAGANCSIHGHFAPTTSGALTAAVTITDNAGNSPQSITLSGTGVPPPVTLSATSLSFGPVNVGSSSGSQSVTMTNTGTAPLSITSIAVTGTNAASFVFANSCATILPVGANCTIHGHFAPTAAGAVTAAVTITDSVAGSPQTIALSGTGAAPIAPVTLSATSLSFGTVNVGSSSGSQSVTMTNTGTATLTITSIAVTGANASSFVFANSCGTTLAVGANCTIHGHFAPTASGALSGAITITDSATGSPQTITLSGIGNGT